MIDYKLINDSIDYYQGLGFTRIETPWTVSEAIIDLTKPNDKASYKIEHTQKCLVGSGEQSFLYQYSKGFLPKGKFQTVTPCFRDDLFSLIHSKYFLKNELIITDDIAPEQGKLFKMVKDSKAFFEKILGREVKMLDTAEGWDIVYEPHSNYGPPIELGSYGFRYTPVVNYLYGTGLAEPRTSFVRNLINS